MGFQVFLTTIIGTVSFVLVFTKDLLVLLVVAFVSTVEE